MNNKLYIHYINANILKNYKTFWTKYNIDINRIHVIYLQRYISLRYLSDIHSPFLFQDYLKTLIRPLIRDFLKLYLRRILNISSDIMNTGLRYR